MARTKQHPSIGKYVARYEHSAGDGSQPDAFNTPEEALADIVDGSMDDGSMDDGDVIYVYAVVGVKVVRKSTVTENFLP